MTRGYEGKLYILAFDHRGSFQEKFFGLKGDPSAEEIAKIVDAKTVIYEGMVAALDRGASRESAGVLVDERFGAEVALRAKALGLILAMPVEKSGQDEFDFEYGSDFGAHIDEYDPVFSKVLVRYNPAGDGAMNERQAVRLRQLGDWLHERDRKILFELLVPPEEHQLVAAGGDVGLYDTEVRPGLMLMAIAELQQAGVEPDVWKIEGLDRRSDCEAISRQARSGGREGVVCVVLGRGADDVAVDHWLRTAAGVPGYAGFAVGRSIWWDPLKGYVEGKLPREDAAARIGANYRRFIDVYEGR